MITRWLEKQAKILFIDTIEGLIETVSEGLNRTDGSKVDYIILSKNISNQLTIQQYTSIVECVENKLNAKVSEVIDPKIKFTEKEPKFTIEQIKAYIHSKDSMGDILYFLSAENIEKANEIEEIFDEE